MEEKTGRQRSKRSLDGLFLFVYLLLSDALALELSHYELQSLDDPGPDVAAYQDRYGQSVDHAVQAAQGVADGVYASGPWNR